VFASSLLSLPLAVPPGLRVECFHSTYEKPYLWLISPLFYYA
jgi:hypothetical protein